MNTIVVESNNLSSIKQSGLKIGLKDFIGGLIFLALAIVAARLITITYFGPYTEGFYYYLIGPILFAFPFGIYSSRSIIKNPSFRRSFIEGIKVPSYSAVIGPTLLVVLSFFESLDLSKIFGVIPFAMIGVFGIVLTFWIIFPCGWIAALLVNLFFAETNNSGKVD